jgi:hypothetical protein
MVRPRQCVRFTVFVAMACLLLGAAQSVPPPWPLPPGVKTVMANGYPMAYLERGVGPPLVLIHGALNDYRSWEAQMSSLSARFRVIAVSLRLLLSGALERPGS